ncbi:uncharacterized protein I206_103203 [Kwoniella pini CBS 10737]|uniref:Uncharacterized protein n=1 Tax=Kwoniella pini CBS 10737 TaxID=1296096 RepID=A0A1B9IA55_9TREE|nr:uncharacterized protein I206_01792 [Kwoniella pini CBS 10737]OCF52502.1 hypothetical protein I206_01792 [Kwoniella pini CBS 10737]
MAIPTSPELGQRSRDDSIDTILDKLARTNTFDSDWPTLRDHLHQSLISTLPLYLSRGPPRPYRPPISPIIGPEPIHLDQTDDEGDIPPSESLLLSPSQPTSASTSSSTPESSTISSNLPRSVEAEPSETPSSGRLESLTTQDDLRPSTIGGLVIPPFPPLDRSRRNSREQISGTSYSGGQILMSPRGVNGIRGGAPRMVTIGPGVMDEEYDEETTIGGKILPGWMDGEEGKRELEKVVAILDEMDVPPFTIQRFSELLLEPTKYYSTFGKFIRAIEKTLLVTTPWEQPSYIPISSTSFTVPQTHSTAGSSSSSSDNGYDSDSTMPPGSTTPMFSPIPFLAQQNDLSLEGAGSSSHEGGMNGTTNRQLDDGLMSPLMLNEESGMFGSSSNPRSPTPEPEDSAAQEEVENDIDMKEEIPERPIVAQGQYESVEHSDPAHQSYLGRVDELDTGPIKTSPPIEYTNSSSSSSLSKNGQNHRHSLSPENIPVPGTGEGGNMTPHGMSEKPVPISSTTVVIKDEKEKEKQQRTIASLPRTTSEKSLRERFVSAGADAEKTSEEKEGKS